MLFGFLIYIVKPFAKVYFLGACGYFLYRIFKSGNRNNEALLAAGYIAGGEVLFRMTGASIAYEAGKYGVIFFILLGLFLSGTSRKSGPYWLYLLLLLCCNNNTIIIAPLIQKMTPFFSMKVSCS